MCIIIRNEQAMFFDTQDIKKKKNIKVNGIYIYIYIYIYIIIIIIYRICRQWKGKGDYILKNILSRVLNTDMSISNPLFQYH